MAERRLLPERLATEPRAVTVVLDDLGEAPGPRQDFLRRLQELACVRIVLVTEGSLGEEIELHLRALIHPPRRIARGPFTQGPPGPRAGPRAFPTGMWQTTMGATAHSPSLAGPPEVGHHPVA